MTSTSKSVPSVEKRTPEKEKRTNLSTREVPQEKGLLSYEFSYSCEEVIHELSGRYPWDAIRIRRYLEKASPVDMICHLQADDERNGASNYYWVQRNLIRVSPTLKDILSRYEYCQVTEQAEDYFKIIAQRKNSHQISLIYIVRTPEAERYFN